MVGRLFKGIHWVLFFTFLGSWGLFLLAIIDSGTDKAVRGLDNKLDGDVSSRIVSLKLINDDLTHRSE